MAGVSGKIRRELEIKIREQDAFPRRIERVGDEVFVIAAALDDLKPLINEAIGPAIKDNTLQPFVMVAREPEGPNWERNLGPDRSGAARCCGSYL